MVVWFGFTHLDWKPLHKRQKLENQTTHGPPEVNNGKCSLAPPWVASFPLLNETKRKNSTHTQQYGKFIWTSLSGHPACEYNYCVNRLRLPGRRLLLLSFKLRHIKPSPPPSPICHRILLAFPNGLLEAIDTPRWRQMCSNNMREMRAVIMQISIYKLFVYFPATTAVHEIAK